MLWRASFPQVTIILTQNATLLYLVLVILFDLPLRALNSRQQDFADKSLLLGRLDFLTATKYGSNTKLIITMDATSFR